MTNEELCIAIQKNEGNKQDHLTELYLKNIGMIEKIIRHYAGVADLEDVRQESFFGILRASELWTPDKGGNFITYAVFWIRQAIRKYLNDCGGAVRIPSYKRDQIGRYKKTVNSYRMMFGRYPSDRELCVALNLKSKQLEDLKKDILASQVRSTSEVIGGENDDLTLEDTIAAEGDAIGDTVEQLQQDELSDELWSCVSELKPQQADVIRARYKEGRTLEECGTAIGLSAQRAKSIHDQALRELRKPRYTKRLLPYLDEGTARSWSLSGTGHGTFEKYGSVQERAMIRLEELSNMNIYYGVRLPELDELKHRA